MRYLSLLPILLFSACISSAPVEVTPEGPLYLQSVRPLQVKIVNLEENSFAMNILRQAGWLEGAQVGETRNICTASATNHAEPQYWLTAAHCVIEIGQEGRYVEGTPIEVVEVNTDLDLAMFVVPGLPRVRGLALSPKPTTWLQDILIVGHPFGYDPVFITRGYVANPRGILEGRPSMLFNVAAAPGNSGSPVLNLKGEVVSVLQFGWGQSFSPVTGGAPYEALRLFESYFAPAPTAAGARLPIETPARPLPVPWE